LTNNLQLSRTELIDFVEQFDRPIVFVDADPAPTVSELPEGVTLVAYHNRKGARLAARHIAKTIATHPNPRVLVLGAELQSTRHETFVKELRKQGREIRCDVEIAHFSRKEAYSAAKMRLRSAHDEESPYQAVFATSDDMALGVVDAIQQLELAEKPLVGAYDGGEEVMTHLHRPDSALQFTIVQETTRLVEEVVKMLEHPANRPRGGRRFLDPGIKEGVRPR
jgi:DNA-binding LacI/PurR family transcriptional regulator